MVDKSHFNGATAVPKVNGVIAVTGEYMEYVYLFLANVLALAIAAAVVVKVVSKRLIRAQQSVQAQTDDYYKQVTEIVLQNQNKLTASILDEVRRMAQTDRKAS